MIEVDSVLFMGLWELVLILLAVDVVILVRFIIRSRREKISIERLVTIVTQDAERREKETRNLLEKKYGYSGEQLEKATKKIIREEKRIYQILANLFTSRDNVAIENLSITFEEVVEPYRALEVPKLIDSNAAAGEGEDNSSEIKRLKNLNQTLNEELRVTMNTLSKMLHEYSVLLADSKIDKEDQAAVASLIVGDQLPEADASSVTAGDVIEESVPDVATEVVSHAEAAPEEADEAVVDMPEEEVAVDENIDSASLVGMFQEEDDDILADDGAVESLVAKSESVEDSLAQEIGEVLENTDVDLSDIELDKADSEPSGVTTDQAEELLTQAIGETLESHETPLPDFEDELLEDETDATEIDPTEALLAQAIGETLESHETPLPDFMDELLEEEADAAEVDATEDLLAQAIGETLETSETAVPDESKKKIAAEPDAEKKLTDEIAETLSGHSEDMSDEDIDSLLQGAIEDISEK